MFTRFRQARDRLNVSIVASARVGARVRQSHIANLGSVPVLSAPADRVRFWIKAHQQLATLDNRLDEETRWAILAAIHARIPMPTAEDQEAARNAGREANASLFSALRDKHRGLARVYRQRAEEAVAAAEAVDGLEAAYASRPMTRTEMRVDRRHWRRPSALPGIGGSLPIGRRGLHSAEAGQERHPGRR